MPFDPDQYLAEKSAAKAAPSAAFDPDAYLSQKTGAKPAAAPEQMGTTESAVRGALGYIAPVVAPVGRFVDRFTGAPVRAAIGAAQHGQNPGLALMNQFGGDPENAPTGKEIAQKAGFSEKTMSDVLPSLYDKDGSGWKLRKGGMLDPTASGAAGLGVDVAADPLNLVGVGEIADVGKAIAKSGAGAAMKGAEIGANVADFATGSRAATRTLDAAKAVVSTAGKVADAAGDTLNSLFKPKLAEDSRAMESIALKNGIPKELISPAHEFGDASSITRLQRTVAEGTMGQKYLETHNAGISKTTDALEKQVVSKFGVPPASSEEAGQLIKDAVDKHVSDTFDNADVTYANAQKKIGTINLDEEGLNALRSKANGMKNEAIRLERTSADPQQLSQAANLRQWSDLILDKADKGESYKELADIVQNVGKAAYTKTPLGQIPSDIKKLRELYNTGSETLIQSVRNHSPATADQLVAHNVDIAEMLGDKSVLGRAISDASLNPEQVYNSLVKNGGSKQIATLEKVLPEDAFNAIRSKFLSDQVKYHTDGSAVKFGETLRNLDKNSEKLSYLFDPHELKDTADLLKFGERYGNPVMSSSGTGASSAFRGAKDKILNAMVDEQTLDAMKSKARSTGSAPVPSVVGSGASAAPETIAVSGRPLLRDRGALGNRLKVAQSVSPSQSARQALLPKGSVGDDAPPAKGPDKWANDGLDKLKEHAGENKIEALKDQALADPRGKKLLIAASDLKPGSKAMQDVAERFLKLYGNTTS
jgi:hypothetical protein